MLFWISLESVWQKGARRKAEKGGKKKKNTTVWLQPSAEKSSAAPEVAFPTSGARVDPGGRASPTWQAVDPGRASPTWQAVDLFRQVYNSDQEDVHLPDLADGQQVRKEAAR